MNNTINERIKKFRTKANISPTEIAEKLNISTEEYLDIENKRDFSCEHIKKIAEILEVNILKILYSSSEYDELKEKMWFIRMINEYNAPYIIHREENDFFKNFYNSSED